MTAARRLSIAVGALLNVASVRAQSPASAGTVPAYRARVLGVFNVDTGQPIEGAEVVDILSRTSALTSKTGTVSLAFLPDTGSLVRIQKIGFRPLTMVVAISPADTVPITALLNPIAQALPALVSKDSSPHHVAPGLNAFEERRRSHAGGMFITDAELRKNDNRKMTDVIRSAGVGVRCSTHPIACFAVSTRGSACSYNVYLDGAPVTGEWRDLEKMPVAEYGGIEIYSGPATIPAEYNMTGSVCGVMLMWTRERH